MKYERACYRDNNGALHWIEPNELNDPITLATARSVRLYDEDEEYRLFPRNREGGPHFFCRSANPRRLISSKEKDGRHDRRRDILKERLENITGLKVGYRHYYGSGKDDFDFVEVAEIEDYKWGTEVTRIVPFNLRIRHDIFGASPVLGMSERRPWIAIEVISTHYMDEETFEAVLDLSKHLPMLVGFDLVDIPNYFTSLDEKTGTLRFIYYMYDGAVWRNDMRTELDTAGKLKAVLQQELRDKSVNRRQL